ncbi:MAG: tRNA guanosine(34) transglycosylase Tgt [Patescibacteria group bacterium]
MTKFSFSLGKTKKHARAGNFVTEHGEVQTPIFMPVGTLATVKALDTQDIQATKAQIILANTYHLYLTPGMEVVEKAGGVHPFMGWDKPMLTDSGGFQVFSLGLQKETSKTHWKSLENDEIHTPSSKISDEGVAFTSHRDGSKHFFSPEKSIEIQRSIGADIIMAFDECTPDQADEAYTRSALDRTHRWAKQCKEYWESQQRLSKYGKYQALFGIVQGAMHPELRKESLQVIKNLDFDGIAFGGETVGYNMAGTVELMNWVRDMLPEDKPRYAMGLGRDPQNLIDAVMAGYDMFDCVAPTRFARNGTLYSGKLEIEKDTPTFVSEFPKGRLQIGNQQFTLDQQVIQPGCDCFTCQKGYSRSYLRHLFKTDELTYFRLSSIHNVRFMVRLSEELREWVTS